MSLLDDVSIVVTPNGYKAGELYAIKPTFALGSELVTNSIFNSDNTSDWGNGFYDLFTFVSSEGGFYNLQRVLADARTNINLSSVLTVGKRYKVTVVARGSGNIKTGLTTSGYTTQPSAVFTLTSSFASYSTIVTVTSGLVYGVLWNDDLNSDIDYQSYSVKEYTSADMDVTRATAATRVDEDGLVNYAEILGDEEVTNGDGSSASGWDLAYPNTTLSIDNNNLRATANSSGAYGLSQSLILDTSKQYIIKATIDVDNASGGTANLRIAANSNLTSGSTTLSTATGISTTILSPSATTMYIGIVDTAINSSNYVEIDNISVKEVTRDNVPRIDYTGGGCPHILAEPQRTNLVTYSEDFTEYSISTTNLDTPTIVSITNPTGVNSAGLLNINNGVSASKFIYLGISTSSSIHTQSIFVKYVDRQWLQLLSGGTSHYANFDIQNGVVGNTSACSSTIEDYGNGWYRCTATLDSAATPSNIVIGVIDDNTAIRLTASTGTGSYYLFGSQVEQGSYATSYIPTSGSTVTRNQDIFTRDGIGSLINDSEGTLYFEGSALENGGGSHRIISLSDGTSNNLIYIRVDSTASRFRGFARGSSGSYTLITVNSVPQTDNNKIALVWDATNFRIWINGSERATAIINDLPVGMNTLNLTDPTSSDPFFGKVKQLQVYNTALTDTQLAALTS